MFALLIVLLNDRVLIENQIRFLLVVLRNKEMEELSCQSDS